MASPSIRITTVGKDLFYVAMMLIVAAFIIFYAPTMGGWFLEHDNFVEANRW